MYRTPTQEPRYKQGTRDRESRGKSRRYEEPKESSEASTSDEDDESTDRYTDESEETTESQCGQGECVWNAAGSSFDRERIFTEPERPEDYLMRAYYANSRVQKHDKITQKNFLSPFPSFLIPPIYRNIGGPPNYRYTTVNNPTGDQGVVINSAKMRSSPNKLENCREERTSSRERREQNLCDKHRAQRGLQYLSRNYRPERILMCMPGESSVERSRQSKNVLGAESFSRNSMRAEGGRRSKNPSRDSKHNHQSITCKDCLQSMENRKKSRRSAVGAGKQRERAMQEPFWGKGSEEGALGSIGPGKVKEKLVYVVEEEGKDVTKLETDLFSVNEILTIKKDLLELSEFAKKLKKLKEMKRNAEKGTAGKSGCQCQPVAELLKDVNKRIEALEARQEELERGSHKTSQKEGTEDVSKKTSEPKTSLDSPLKMPAVRKQSAMTGVPSFPKTEMIVSREGLSNNSEIVNELMDIKTQLQKLEKKRMTKEMTPEAAPLGESKVTKKKDHAIAVFSSRTYILTTENFEKKKKQQSVREDGKVKGCILAAKNPRNKSDQTKENVANWLRNVSPVGERSVKESPAVVEADESKRNDDQLKYCNWNHVSKGYCLDNQEPPKNRASEVKSTRQGSKALNALPKNEMMTKPLKEPVPHLSCKECIMTRSGRLYFRKPSDECPRDVAVQGKATWKPLPPSQSKLAHRSCSSCSMPSAILAKEYARRLNNHTLKEIFRESSRCAVSYSKSTQELSTSSSCCKEQKTVRNMNVKNLRSPPPKDKTHKESKNEYVKRLEGNCTERKNFRRDDEISSSVSEFIRTINLDTDKGSNLTSRQGEIYRNNLQVYSVGAVDVPWKIKEECVPKDTARERRRQEGQYQKEGYSGHRGEVSSPPERLSERKKEQERKTVGEETCECACCCKKKVKAPNEEEKLCESKSFAEAPESGESKDSKERRKRMSSAEKMARRRERKERMSERRREKKEERRRRRERKKESKERMRKKRSRERMKKSKSRERIKECKSKERIKEKRSKTSQKSRRKRSAKRICRSAQRVFHRCQVPKAPSYCRSECLPSSSCCRQVEQQSCEEIKPPVPIRSITKSTDSMELYLRHQRNKPEPPKPKIMDDSCLFRNICRNFRKLYPKFSNFQLGNFSGDLFDAKPSSQHYQHHRQRHRVMGSSEDDGSDDEDEDDDDDDDDDENEDDYYCERFSGRRNSHDLKCRHRSQHHHQQHQHQQQQRHQQRHQQHHHRQHQHQHDSKSPTSHYYNDSPRATRPEHLRNCRCVRVYLQAQGHQKWPGIEGLRCPSDENPQALSSSKSSESSKTIKRDFIFPGQLPESHLVGYSSERRRRKRRRHRDGRHKRRRRRRDKRKPRPSLCVCDRCGNIHEKERPKKEKVRYDESAEKSRSEDKMCKCDDKVRPAGATIPKILSPAHFPMFSFFKYFCKGKPENKLTMNSILELKTCAGTSRKGKSEKRSSSSLKRAEDRCCRCRPKLSEIEERLLDLEKRSGRRKRKKEDRINDEECEDYGSDSERKRKRKKKKKKKRRKRYCYCPENEENAERMEKRRRRRKKDRDNDCETYYCKCSTANKIPDVTETNETSESLGTRTTTTTTQTTTTTTTTTPPTTEASKSCKDMHVQSNHRKKDWGLKQKISSFQSLVNNFQQRCKKPKPQCDSNVFVMRQADLINDCSKSSPMPRKRIVHKLKSQSSGFLKRIKKLKGKGKEQKKGCEKEKGKAQKKESPRVKSLKNRHKC